MRECDEIKDNILLRVTPADRDGKTALLFTRKVIILLVQT